jgi:hypothetical protein
MENAMGDDFDEDVPNMLHLVPFFELEDPDDPDCERFVAGFKNKNGEHWGAIVPVRRDIVESVVLKLNVLEPSITADGIVRAWPAEKSSEFYAELAEANALEQISIDELIFQRVDTDIDEPNEGEGGVLAAYSALRVRLKEALNIVETEILRRGTPGAAPDPKRLN